MYTNINHMLKMRLLEKYLTTNGMERKYVSLEHLLRMVLMQKQLMAI